MYESIALRDGADARREQGHVRERTAIDRDHARKRSGPDNYELALHAEDAGGHGRCAGDHLARRQATCARMPN